MENKLPVEFKTKWLEALRSGEYKQCQEVLCQGLYEDSEENEDGSVDDVYVGEGYCCLGVAAHMLGMDMEKYGALGLPNDVEEDELERVGYPELLRQPYRVDSKGKPSMIGIDSKTEVGVLAHMNDSGSTFTEIAQYIEENL